jgi:hypothetical protein
MHIGRRWADVARTTISVPDELKARMEQASSTNWSAVACRAFEQTLGDIAAQKREKTMQDVIERLRATKLAHEDEMTKAGREAGRIWAREVATYDELRRAAEYTDFGVGEPIGPYSHQDLLAFHILGIEEDDDRNMKAFGRVPPSEEFWDRVAAEADVSEKQLLNEDFTVGFLEGASGVWDEVANKI